jgi:hypothetical protein
MQQPTCEYPRLDERSTADHGCCHACAREAGGPLAVAEHVTIAHQGQACLCSDACTLPTCRQTQQQEQQQQQ